MRNGRAKGWIDGTWRLIIESSFKPDGSPGTLWCATIQRLQLEAVADAPKLDFPKVGSGPQAQKGRTMTEAQIEKFTNMLEKAVDLADEAAELLQEGDTVQAEATFEKAKTQARAALDGPMRKVVVKVRKAKQPEAAAPSGEGAAF